MIARFVSTTTALVQKELDAEQAAVASLIAPLLKGNATSAHGSSWTALQRNGTALLNLAVTAMRSGLAGKTLVDFEPSASTATSELPPHRFRVGDVVALVSHAARRDGKKGHAETSSSADSINGVICRIKPALITVVISSDSARGDESLLFSGSDANDRWRVVQLGNEITYKRMMEAMSALEQIASEAANVPSQGINSTPKLPIIPSHHSELRDLIPVLIGTSPSAPVFEADSNNIPQFFTSDLNESQKDAIQFALSARHVALIHGPPGTGKSHTLVELIRQLVESKHERVLVCGPSNTAVDTLAERLSHCGLNMARVGHPARVKTALLDHCLEVRVRTSDEGQLVNDVRNDVDRTLAQISKCKKRSERKILYGELKLLRKELRERERTVVETIVRNCQVVLCTLSGCLSTSLRNVLFDTVIIDESSQAIEAESWIAILKGKRVILAGDHMQLPPTVKSERGTVPTNTPSLQITLFDRLLRMYGEGIKRMLNVQYRMHESIMQFPSQHLYGGKLIAHEGVRSHLLSDISGVEQTEETTCPLLLYDTSSAGLNEESEASTASGSLSGFAQESTLNPGEANLVLDHLLTLLNAGVPASSIIVITPYSAQVRHIKLSLQSRAASATSPSSKESLFSQIEVGTVDAFQGSERDAVLLSLVRSNEDREVGFLGDERRLNVAVTRARRHLAVFADVRCLSGGGGAFLKGFLAFVEDHGLVRFVE